MKKILLIILLFISNLTYSQDLKSTTFKKGSLLSIKESEVVKNNPDFITYQTDTLAGLVILIIDCSDDYSEVIGSLTIGYYFRTRGATVIQLYKPKMDSIKYYLPLADIIYYKGHGNTLDINGNTNKNGLNNYNSVKDTIPVGFMCSYLINTKINGVLTKTNRVDILDYYTLKDIKLPKNPIIIFHNVCTAAGSSANDRGGLDIGWEEAERRVTSYGKMFIQMGASVFVADNRSGVMFPGDGLIWLIVRNYTINSILEKRLVENIEVKKINLINNNKLYLTKNLKIKSYSFAIYGNVDFRLSDLSLRNK